MRSRKYLRSATTRMPLTPCEVLPCALALEEKAPLNGIVVLDIDVDPQAGVGHLEPWSLAHIGGGTSNGGEDGVMQRGGCTCRPQVRLEFGVNVSADLEVTFPLLHREDNGGPLHPYHLAKQLGKVSQWTS